MREKRENFSRALEYARLALISARRLNRPSMDPLERARLVRHEARFLKRIAKLEHRIKSGSQPGCQRPLLGDQASV